jgi:hypothetical protein
VSERRELVHFREACRGGTLCGGAGEEAHAVAVRGVPLCAECVRVLTEQASRIDYSADARSELRPLRKRHPPGHAH